MARILVVDDDDSLLSVLSLALEDASHAVQTAKDGMAALQLMEQHEPDVLISDVNMPRLDGFALLRKLRDKGVACPIILLTSRDSEIDEALGLELGADDYVSKPFSMRVLLARVTALLRRKQLRDGKEVELPRQLGQLEMFPERLEVRYAQKPIEVTVTEFKLLEALTRRPGVVLSRDRLLELARGDDSVVAERIIDTYVRRLRRKFEAVQPGFDEIETVVGAGYCWRRRD